MEILIKWVINDPYSFSIVFLTLVTVLTTTILIVKEKLESLEIRVGKFYFRFKCFEKKSDQNEKPYSYPPLFVDFFVRLPGSHRKRRH